mmetsp:Transcript_68101/g.197355  ORF Transcript_68101/g.197355 Transcript_68101/m.197355 type:complete len:619 (+) Transcript_68101:75-1931(+)
MSAVLRPGFVLELCGESVDPSVPAEQRCLDLSALLSVGDGDAGVIVGKAKQPELHKRCISKDALPFVAGDHFRIWHDGQAFMVQSMTSKPMWVEHPQDLENQPAHPFQHDAQPLTELTEDEPVLLSIGGHIVLSVGASNLWPGDLAKRLRWRLGDMAEPEVSTKDESCFESREIMCSSPVKSLKVEDQDPDSDAENRCDRNGQQRMFRPSQQALQKMREQLSVSEGQPMLGKHCFFCHMGLPAEDGCKLAGRWFCSLDHHSYFVRHGRRPPPQKAILQEATAGADATAQADIAAPAASMTPLKQRRCSQPMSGTLGKRRPGGVVVAGAPPPVTGGSLPSKKLQATPEQLAIKELWFGPCGVDVALMCRGAMKCRLTARRVWMVKTLLERVGEKLHVNPSELCLQAFGVGGEAFSEKALLGDIIPLQDVSCSFELLWKAGSLDDLPTVARISFGGEKVKRASCGAPPPVGEVEVSVTGLGEEVMGIVVSRSWHISHLKNEIAKRKKIAPWEMKLLFGEVILDDGDSIDARFPGPAAEVTLVKLTDWPEHVHPEEEMRLFEVVASHVPTTPSGMELELRPGERICVVEQDASGWWGGYRLQEGPEVLGWFPGNCVRRVAG